MKAYQVTEPDEGHSVITFAKHSVVARREGANELNIDFECVERCERKPQFDQYAAAGCVPVQALLKDGWWFECQHCSARVGEDGPDWASDDDAVLIHIDGRSVYCNSECFHARNTEKMLDALRTQALVDCANEKYYGCTVTTVSAYRGDEFACLKLPNSEIHVTWYKTRDFISLAQQDIPAWEAFTGKPADLIKGEKRP